MKKFLGIIITIMMLLISVPFVSTNSFGISINTNVPSQANIIESPAEIVDAWIDIINMDGIKIWNSTEGADLRADSYINDGEKLVVNVIIHDDNGIYINPPSHVIHANLSPDDTSLGILDFKYYIGEGQTTAFFNLTYIIPDPEVLQCRHDVYIYVNDGDHHEIWDPLYINPYVMSTFTPGSVVWSELYAGTTDKEADGNPYEHNVSAYCEVLGAPDEYVDVDYQISINGSNMTQAGVPDIIPRENIRYDMGGSSYPLPETPTLLGHFIANTPLTFNFTIDIPNIIQAGSYTGEINYIVQVI